MVNKQFRVKEFGADKKKVIFFFAGMGTRIGLYRGSISKFVKNGYHVVAYDFDPLIVRNGDADNFIAVAEDATKDVREHVTQAKAAGIKVFHTFGVSMGTLLAIKCAAEMPEISKVVINLTYGSVAENVWTWWFIKPAKKRAIEQGYTMTALDKKLEPISPIPNAPKLKGKSVLLYLSKRDKILLFKQSSQFREALDEAGVDYEYYENRYVGHIATGFVNFLRPKRYLDFLNS